MTKMTEPDAIALSDLRRNAKRYVRKVSSGAGPFAITRRGEWVAVLMSAERFQQLVTKKTTKTPRKTKAKSSANGVVKKPRKKKSSAAG